MGASHRFRMIEGWSLEIELSSVARCAVLNVCASAAAACCGVYFLPVGLLQLAALRAAGQSAVQAAVCAEFHCTTDLWHATQWSYLAGITRTPLTTHLRARQVQCGMPGSPVTVRAGASLLGQQLPSRVRQHSALSAVSWYFDLHGTANTLSSYGNRTFAAAGPRLWNSLLVQLRNPDITCGLFWRQLKGHLFREAWTRRSVTSDMWRRRNALTYLLTYGKYLHKS